MILDKNTKICISISSIPSNFGTTLHNAAFRSLGLNYIYKSMAIADLKGALVGVRALNIRGCSVSMPYKEAVLPLLDSLDNIAKEIGAVNTIVNNDGILHGYNTDVIGARKVLKSLGISRNDTILLLGAGGVSRAILFVLREIGCRRVKVSNRHLEKLYNLNDIMQFEPIAWEERSRAESDLIINATSIGMDPFIDCCPVEADAISRTNAVFDVVVSPNETRLIALARSMRKVVSPGYLMSLEQAIKQFELYTGEVPPREVMERSLKELLT